MSYCKGIIISLFCILLQGCNVADKIALKVGYEQKIQIERRIDNLNKQHQVDIQIASKNIENKYEGLLAQVKRNFQETSNWVYGASLASELKENKNRLDNILDLRIKTARSFGLPPTPEAMIEQARLLKEELDELKVSNADLEKRYDEKIKEAEKAQVALTKKDNELISAKQARLELEEKYRTELLNLNEQLATTQNKIISLEKQRADDRAAIHAAKLKASFTLGAIALLALAGAIYSPIAKDKCAIFAAIVGGAGVGIWYIEPWMIATSAGILIVVVVGLILYRLNREKIKASGSMWTLQKIRETNPEIHEKVSKIELKDWFDESLHKEVEADLRDMNATYSKN